MLKLISLNIEGDNHLDRVVNFLRQEKPDVVCLQEVFQVDVKYLEKMLEMKGKYAPMMEVKSNNQIRLTPKGLWGLLILTKLPVSRVYLRYYAGTKDHIPVFSDDNPNSNNRALLGINLAKNQTQFTVMTTHFTYSFNGIATPLQHARLDQMLKLLTDIDEFVLCGDFNAPRGGEIQTRLAKHYTDNIPAEIETTMDPELHRVKNLKLVVDGIYSTPAYGVSNVAVVGGISDHKAIIGTITINPTNLGVHPKR